MARLTILDHPTLPTYVELRLWAAAGKRGQAFQLGEGGNLDAGRTLWWEIIQVMTGRRIFYFRHFLDCRRVTDFGSQTTSFWQGECSEVGISGRWPESGFLLRRVAAEANDSGDSSRLPDHYALEVWLPDVGFARAGVLDMQAIFTDNRMTFTHTTYNVESVRSFLAALAAEMAQALAGKWLDPRSFDPAASRWSLAEQLNTLAYDFLAGEFSENYFKRRPAAEAFNRWIAQIPAGGRVLDIGCGHGSPVVGRLLSAGLQVTGIDISPVMLERARENYPQASFIQGTVQDLPEEAVFAAACSFSALLYLDPIDLSFALLRLHSALMPGGLLFLYSFFDHPDWTGEPIDRGMGAPMWAWDYDMEAASAALSAHGLFGVIEHHDFTPPGKGSGPYVLVARQLP